MVAVLQTQAQEVLGIYTTLPQFGNGESTILYLSGNELFGGFNLIDSWLINVHFPATPTESSADFQFLGPIDSVYPPQDGFPGGETISYDADFTLDDSQVQLLLSGQAQIELTQDLFSTGPNFTPQTAQGFLLPVSSTFTSTFNGDNEIPPNHSNNSGNGTFILEGNVLSYNLTLDGSFAPTSAGIFATLTPKTISGHLIADLGNASISNLSPIPFPPTGPVPFDLQRPSIISQPPVALVYSGQITLGSSQVAELLAGKFYVNFKSAKFRQGELRGEILPAPLPAPFLAPTLIDGYLGN